MTARHEAINLGEESEMTGQVGVKLDRYNKWQATEKSVGRTGSASV